MSKQKVSLIIFTDVGEEIDDEIALFWFLNFVYDVNKYHVTIVFTEGVAGASITPFERYEIFRKYFPNSPKAVRYIYELLYLGDIKGRIYDKMLQIAPLRGVPVQFFAQNTFKVLYLMGNRSPYPGSINTFKSFVDSEGDMKQYNDQLKYLKKVRTISISTELCRKIPLTCSLVQKLPEVFSSQLFEKAYEQFVGRVKASYPYCYDVTFDINYKTIMRYVDGNTFFAIYKQEYENSPRICNLVKCFYDSIERKPIHADRASDVNKLKEIILVVEFLTEEYYRDSTLQKGPKHFAMYHRNLERWKKKVLSQGCSLTPAYDLLAMFAMVKNLTEKDLKAFDTDELSKMLEEGFL